MVAVGIRSHDCAADSVVVGNRKSAVGRGVNHRRFVEERVQRRLDSIEDDLDALCAGDFQVADRMELKLVNSAMTEGVSWAELKATCSVS